MIDLIDIIKILFKPLKVSKEKNSQNKHHLHQDIFSLEYKHLHILGKKPKKFKKVMK